MFASKTEVHPVLIEEMLSQEMESLKTGIYYFLPESGTQIS